MKNPFDQRGEFVLGCLLLLAFLYGLISALPEESEKIFVVALVMFAIVAFDIGGGGIA